MHKYSYKKILDAGYKFSLIQCVVDLPPKIFDLQVKPNDDATI